MCSDLFQNRGHAKKRTEAASGLILPTTKPDMSNYIKSIEDALNGVLWHDDNATVDIHGKKRYAETGYLTVEIKKIEVSSNENVLQHLCEW